MVALGLSEHILNIEATDFSSEMIAAAKQKAAQMGVSSVQFSVQDACKLQYPLSNVDTVIISNALHIMPEPEKALMEIKRVLRPGGRLIAPTFVYGESLKAALLSSLMMLTGFRAYHKWTAESYHEFFEENGL